MWQPFFFQCTQTFTSRFFWKHKKARHLRTTIKNEMNVPCICPDLHLNCHLSCIRIVLCLPASELPPVLHPYCTMSVLSCIWRILIPSGPASFLFCIWTVLHLTCPVPFCPASIKGTILEQLSATRHATTLRPHNTIALSRKLSPAPTTGKM